MNYAVIDVETTGLSPGGNDRIVEIAIVRLAADYSIQREFNSLLNPGRDIGPSWLHGIQTRDVLEAPKFLDIAGGIVEHLTGALIVGHNVSFDLRFLESEFGRGGIVVPNAPYTDTLSLALRAGSPSRRLDETCAHFGIPLDHAHSALCDARATAALFAKCVQLLGADRVQERLVRRAEPVGHGWPVLEMRRAVWPRQESEHSRSKPSFVASLVRRLPAQRDEPGDWQDYYSLLDRALENRRIATEEAAVLEQAALDAGLSASDVRSANKAYLKGLITVAMRDRVICESERQDIREVAELLGLEQALPHLLAEVSDFDRSDEVASPSSDLSLEGCTVCFTGAMNASIDGVRASREKAAAVATDYGMIVARGVTKRLDFLVIADPDSLSGKAMKARSYGTRILAESVFWNLMGVNTDG